VTLHQLSQACIFIYSSRGKWVFPLLLWSFPPTATFTSFHAPDCWAGAATPAFSGWLVYLQLTWKVGLPPSSVEFSSHCHVYKISSSWLPGMCHRSCLLQLACCEGFPLPPFSTQGTPPSLLCVFFAVIAYYCFFLIFSMGGVRSVQGAMLIWPRVVCGSTICCLAPPVVCIFPSGLDVAVWWGHGSPPGFSIEHGVEMLCTAWECGGVKVLPRLGGFSYKVYLQCLSKILL
jgi:hypothetical protein